jgi:hypothetical protein
MPKVWRTDTVMSGIPFGISVGDTVLADAVSGMIFIVFSFSGFVGSGRKVAGFQG